MSSLNNRDADISPILGQTVGQNTQSFSLSNAVNRDFYLFAIPGQRAIINQQSDLPAITIPGVGASLDSFAVTIQSFLGLGRRFTISGEFTVFENHLGLVLRNNRRVVYSDAEGGDIEHPDGLLERAAVKLLDDADPVLGAMVHNNSGNAHHRAGKTDEAIAEYKRSSGRSRKRCSALQSWQRLSRPREVS
jgi:hypothetical protein